VQGLAVEVVGEGIVGREPRALFILSTCAVEVSDLRQLQDIMTAIKEVPDVMNVERVRGL